MTDPYREVGMDHPHLRTDEYPRSPEFREIDRLRAINAELVAALSALLNCVDGVHDYDWLERCKIRAHNAIAKAEKVQS